MPEVTAEPARWVVRHLEKRVASVHLGTSLVAAGNVAGRRHTHRRRSGRSVPRGGELVAGRGECWRRFRGCGACTASPSGHAGRRRCSWPAVCPAGPHSGRWGRGERAHRDVRGEVGDGGVVAGRPGVRDGGVRSADAQVGADREMTGTVDRQVGVPSDDGVALVAGSPDERWLSYSVPSDSTGPSLPDPRATRGRQVGLWKAVRSTAHLRAVPSRAGVLAARRGR